MNATHHTPKSERSGSLILLCLCFMCLFLSAGYGEGNFPAWYATTTQLNIRTADNTNSRILTTLPRNTRVEVTGMTANRWAILSYNGKTAYASSRYLRYLGPVTIQTQQTAEPAPVKKEKSLISKLFDIAVNIGILCLFLFIVRWAFVTALGIFSGLLYKGYYLLSLPFYVLNALQRHLSKPWRIFYKRHNGKSDYANAELRRKLELAKIPIYVLLTPLRFINAVYFNLFIHCLFEGFYYLAEVVLPAGDERSNDNFLSWMLWLPWRIVKYPLWHGSLTLIESMIWTAIDTVMPALTLYHGTNETASCSITQSPGRVNSGDWYTGVWNVGGGNYAGNGIYFAPVRSTAYHYSCGTLIVCRVSLGRVLDLGMAPRYIYNQCGYPNATGTTDWGLRNGYATGEWWRGDRNWWEYCMYDWQNRYNESWRIRPLYVLNLHEECIQRIPGGMTHWLFRRMVLEDIGDTLNRLLS